MNMQIEIINNNNILKTLYQNFVQPTGVHYNHSEIPSVRLRSSSDKAYIFPS